MPKNNLRSLVLALGFAILALAAAGCATNAATPQDPNATAGPVSFSADVLPILSGRCVSCHAGTRASGGLDLSSYATLMAGAPSGAVVVPGDAGASLLVEKVTSGAMPKAGLPLSSGQVQILRDWVDQGALDN